MKNNLNVNIDKNFNWEIIQKELETSMALCGCRSPGELSRDILRIPADFSGNWTEGV